MGALVWLSSSEYRKQIEDALSGLPYELVLRISVAIVLLGLLVNLFSLVRLGLIAGAALLFYPGETMDVGFFGLTLNGPAATAGKGAAASRANAAGTGRHAAVAPKPAGRGALPSCIKRVTAKFADPAVRASLKGFTKTVQITLTDLNEDYAFIINDGRLSKMERKRLPDADVVMNVTSATFDAILNKTVNLMMATLTGKLKVKGSQADLVRLQVLMK